jgi:hypothetical protein
MGRMLDFEEADRAVSEQEVGPTGSTTCVQHSSGEGLNGSTETGRRID